MIRAEAAPFSSTTEPTSRTTGPVQRHLPGFALSEIEQSVIDRFEFIVNECTDRPAVCSRGQMLSYGELNNAVNQTTHAILAHCGPGSEPIALLLDHDTPVIIALLAVLKAGKAYVALEPMHPQAKHQALLTDLQPRLLITNDQHRVLAETMVAESPLEKIMILNVDRLPADLPLVNPGLAITPETPIAIFYTSGSTGQPKGVVRTHRFFLYRVWLETHFDQININDHFSQLISASFGSSISHTFGALLNGATLWLYDLRQNGLGAFRQWLHESGITTLQLPVAFYRQWVETLTHHDFFPQLRLVIPTGQLFRRDVERLWQHFPTTCHLISRYSSTETGMVCRMVIHSDTVIQSAIVPVGYPLPNQEVSLLDEVGQPVDIGQVGEIVVRSRYLSAGYWRRPGLTNQTFSATPNDAQLLYHTGDLGRMTADGCLEFIGRKDEQVKIRGYRVERSEVSAALHCLPGIRAAAVTVNENSVGEKQLIAYLVATGDPAPTTSEVRSGLAALLPDYMIPTSFIMLDQLPLTANGKLDRQRLPQPASERPALAKPYRAPRTAFEATLARLWSDILGVQPIGIDDNFLDLGGHSLAATRIVMRILSHFRVDLPLGALFEAPTIADMAIVITQRQVAQLDDNELQQLRATLEMPEISGRFMLEAPIHPV
ncbi:MAG: non-ribosomal peptide synthetase [Chloroflexi bacterium]|nr:non-ribosomal peptide synthetase [Chloroflexota bacterium]